MTIRCPRTSEKGAEDMDDFRNAVARNVELADQLRAEGDQETADELDELTIHVVDFVASEETLS